MKKKKKTIYLAKMLPIVGKIEIGTLFALRSMPQYSAEAIKITGRNVYSIPTDTKKLTPFPISKVSKVALFLVSRNITKGEWVYHREGSFGAVDTQRNGLFQVRYSKTFISDALEEDLWCIHGLISPAAKWIKDGDMIESSSLGNPMMKVIENPYDTIPVKIDCEIYPIKCPCCDTFK